MDIDKKAIGSRIKTIRHNKGMTLHEFGSVVDDADRSIVSRWERGVSLPNNARLKIIAELGGITVDELLYGNKEEFTNNLVRQVYGDLVNTHVRYKVPQEKAEELIQKAVKTILNAPIAKNTDYIGSHYAFMILYDVFDTYYKDTVFSNENAIDLVDFKLSELSELVADYFIDQVTSEDDNDLTYTIKEGLSEDLYNQLDDMLEKASDTIDRLKKEYPDDSEFY